MHQQDEDPMQQSSHSLGFPISCDKNLQQLYSNQTLLSHEKTCSVFKWQSARKNIKVSPS